MTVELTFTLRDSSRSIWHAGQWDQELAGQTKRLADGRHRVSIDVEDVFAFLAEMRCDEAVSCPTCSNVVDCDVSIDGIRQAIPVWRLVVQTEALIERVYEDGRRDGQPATPSSPSLLMPLPVGRDR